MQKETTKFYSLEPDYDRPVFEISSEFRKKILEKLIFLYGEPEGNECLGELERIMQVHYADKTLEVIDQEKGFDPKDRFSQEDVILITYGDLIQSQDTPPLEVLEDFSNIYLKEG